jgi:hypothetical protein
MISLNAFLENVYAEAEAEAETVEQRRDIKDLIADAKRQGLIQTQGEKRALKEALRCKLAKIDRTGGTKAAQLATLESLWMDVTPVMAELWLQNNVKNRSVSQDTVNGYAREMVNGRWLPNHQGIAFDNLHALNDGQHRLRAIVQSGCTVRMMVTFGLPSKVEGELMTGMDTIDRGRTRSVADQLKVQHGMKGGCVLTMICNRLAGMCSPERTRRLSVGEILDIHETFRPEVDWLVKNRPKAKGVKKAGVLAGFAFALASARGGDASEDGPLMEKMFFQLCGVEPLDEGSPIALLHAFLTSDAAILLTTGNDRALAELVCQAIWLQIHGRKIEQLEQGMEGIAYFRLMQAARVERIAKMFRVPGVKAVQNGAMKRFATA